MAAASHTVGINFIANSTQAQTALNGLHTSLNKLGTAAGGARTPLGGMAMSLGKVAMVAGTVMLALNSLIRVVGSLSSSFYQTSAAFESAMAELQAVVAEDHPADLGKSMEYLSYVAREAGKNTRYSAVEAAQGLRELAKAGKTATESANMLVPTLHMAQLGGLELGDAAEKLADIMSAFGKDSSEATRVVDILAFTAAKSTTDIQQMAEAFKYVSAAGGGMGQSLEGISAGIGVLSGMGVKASMAGTALRGTLVQLADTGSVAHRDLLRLGLTTQDILPSATNSLADIMKKAKERGLDASNAYAIFGQRAGVAANVFTQFYERLEEFNEALEDVDGAAKRMADTMDNTMEVAVMKLKNAWDELMLTFKDTGVWQWMTDQVKRTTEGIKNLTTIIQTLQNAFTTGQLGSLLYEALIVSIAPAVNFLYEGLMVAVHGTGLALQSAFSLVANPNFWKGVWMVFQGAGFELKRLAFETMAFLVGASSEFTAPLIAGFDWLRNTITGAFYEAVAIYYENIHPAVMEWVEIFQRIWGGAKDVAMWVADKHTEVWNWVFGKVVSIQNKFVEIRDGLVNSAIEFGKKLWDYLEPVASFFDISAPAWFEEGVDKSAESGKAFMDGIKEKLGEADYLDPQKDARADAAREKAAAAFGKSFGDSMEGANAKLKGIMDGLKDDAAFAGMQGGFADAMGKYLVGGAMSDAGRQFTEGMAALDIADLIDMDAHVGKLYELVLGNMPRTPEAPDDEKGEKKGEQGGGGGAQERTIALAGAARVALNTIMGRTANEIIAEVAADQLAVQKKELKVAEDTKVELQKLNEKIDGRPNASTFQ